jgi:hypothetical protein
MENVARVFIVWYGWLFADVLIGDGNEKSKEIPEQQFERGTA